MVEFSWRCDRLGARSRNNAPLEWWRGRGDLTLSLADGWGRPHTPNDPDVSSVVAELTVRLHNTFPRPVQVELAAVRFLDSAGTFVCNDPVPRLSYEESPGSFVNAVTASEKSVIRVEVKTMSRSIRIGDSENYDFEAMKSEFDRITTVEVDFLVLPDTHRTVRVQLADLKGLLDPALWQETRERHSRRILG